VNDKSRVLRWHGHCGVRRISEIQENPAMSINAVSQPSSIWTSATSALTTTPDATGLTSAKPNEAGGTTTTPKPGSVGTTPFEQLSSNLQAVLVQMQAGQGSQTATSPNPVPHAHGHHHHAAQADSTATPATTGTLSAVA
jgi:hypothetical protein